MSNLFLPGTSDLALALREPALLVPGRKPVGPIKIDWGNPITRGLQVAWSAMAGAGVSEAVSGAIFPFPSGVSWQGSDLYFDATSSAYLDAPYSTTLACIASQEATIFFVAKPLDYATSDRRAFGLYGGANGYKFVGLWVDTAGAGDSWAALFANSNTNVGENDTAFFYPTRFQSVGAVCNMNGSGYGRLYVDGSLRGQVTGTEYPFVDDPAGKRFRLGALEGLTPNYKGWVRCAYIWSRALSGAEMAALSHDPFLVFAPANSSPYLLSIPGGATAALPTLSAPTLVSAGGNDYYPRVTATYS